LIELRKKIKWFYNVFLGLARRGLAGQGMAWHGKAWSNLIGIFFFRLNYVKIQLILIGGVKNRFNAA